MRKPRPVADRFWPKVRKADGCWEWTGFRDRKGYGSISVGGRAGRPCLAHRVSWEIHHGPIPDGVFVCHHCDNPGCVNPAHLFLGTNADNMQDCVVKGRSNFQTRNPFATLRLSDNTIAEIRRRRHAGEAGTSIARSLGVGRTYVYSLCEPNSRHRRVPRDGDIRG
jgi:hypothetical protein